MQLGELLDGVAFVRNNGEASNHGRRSNDGEEERACVYKQSMVACDSVEVSDDCLLYRREIMRYDFSMFWGPYNTAMSPVCWAHF